MLLAEHDLTVQRPLRPIDGRDLRWLDQGTRRYVLVTLEPDPSEGDEPPF